ncbi:HNH endonuclease [Burkholderia ubonensis]|uniref:HNH endonuclease n=1 Tax=Burkholderia ubonensis TaxID=101571 RepID=UPI0039F5150E
MVPLAMGGAHLPENVQCACRKCNGEKGASARGQLWLAGFADALPTRKARTN